MSYSAITLPLLILIRSITETRHHVTRPHPFTAFLYSRISCLAEMAEPTLHAIFSGATRRRRSRAREPLASPIQLEIRTRQQDGQHSLRYRTLQLLRVNR